MILDFCHAAVKIFDMPSSHFATLDCGVYSFPCSAIQDASVSAGPERGKAAAQLALARKKSIKLKWLAPTLTLEACPAWGEG